jgi:carbamoyl-phosphate synthase large subunit
VDFVFLGLDLEIAALAEMGRELPVPTALAPLRVLPVLLDKAETERVGRNTGVLPRTVRFQGADAVESVFSQLDFPMWVRPARGTSGKGSLKVNSRAEAKAWLQAAVSLGATGEWIAQEFLPGRNTNWSGVFVNGEVVAWASMQRLEYLLGEIAPSGVTGQVKLCETIVMPELNEAALRVVHAIDSKPHGIYSVDLREDVAGAPKVTEINPRLAGRPWLYTQAGSNLPLAALRALRGLPVGDAVAPGGLRPNMQMYRQVDVEPLFGLRDA